MLPEDAEQVTGLTQELGYDMAVTDTRERILALAEGGAMFVAVARSEVVGWIQGLSRELLIYPTILEVGGLVVTENAQRQGIGKALLAALADWGREHGHTRMFVRSSIRRDGAHRFYESLGFKHEKTSHTFSMEIG